MEPYDIDHYPNQFDRFDVWQEMERRRQQEEQRILKEMRSKAWADHLENQRKLAEYKAQKKAQKEEQEREKKRAGLESALRERARLWETYTGETPSPDQLRSWREEYVVMRQAEADLEREEKLRRAGEADHYPSVQEY